MAVSSVLFLVMMCTMFRVIDLLVMYNNVLRVCFSLQANKADEEFTDLDGDDEIRLLDPDHIREQLGISDTPIQEPTQELLRLNVNNHIAIEEEGEADSEPEFRLRVNSTSKGTQYL